MQSDRASLRRLLAIALALALTGTAAADELADAEAAYESGDYPTAVRLTRALAVQGNPIAQRRLGICFLRGQGVSQDPAEALKWFRLAADQGDAIAQHQVGAMHANGEGVPKSSTEAVKWFKLAAQQGNAPAQGALGSLAYEGRGMPQDYELAVKWLAASANQGFGPAQLHLGAVYAEAQDFVRAYQWFELAQRDEISREAATENLERLKGRMNPEQLAEGQRLAREWRPNSGSPTDPGVLGLMPDRESLEVRVQAFRAAMGSRDAKGMYQVTSPAFREAFSLNRFKGELGLDRAWSSEPPTQVAAKLAQVCSCSAWEYEDKRRTLRCLLLVSEIAGGTSKEHRSVELWEHEDGQWYWNIGSVFSNFDTCPQRDETEGTEETNDATALRLYREAADAGAREAQSNLAYIYMYGLRGVPKDYAEAVKWGRRAAEQGDIDAQNLLAGIYFDGEVLPQDYAEALKWRRRAAEQGDALAQLSLGAWYSSGKGIPQDYVEAHKWFNLLTTSSNKGLAVIATDALEALAAKMTPEQIAEAQRLAREWKPKPEQVTTKE